MHSFKSIPHNGMPRTIPLPESENPYQPNTQNTMNRLRVQRWGENTKCDHCGGKSYIVHYNDHSWHDFFSNSLDRAPWHF